MLCAAGPSAAILSNNLSGSLTCAQVPPAEIGSARMLRQTGTPFGECAGGLLKDACDAAPPVHLASLVIVCAAAPGA